MKVKKSRINVYNFHDKDAWKKYKQMTSKNELPNCIKGVNLLEESRIWMKKFKNILQRSFKMIRGSRRKHIDILHNYMLRKSLLLEKIVFIKNASKLEEGAKIQLIFSCEKEIENIDHVIAEFSSSKNARIIKEHYANLAENGAFSVRKMWSLKQKLNLKNIDYPTAKMDNFGNLITTENGILELYKQEYSSMLSHTVPHPGYEKLQNMKDLLFKLRYEIGANNKTKSWSHESLLKICSSLKKK